MSDQKKRALLLFSGGLDSIVAAKLLQSQGIEVTGLSFESYFFDTDRAEKTAREIGIEFMKKDISKEQLKIVKSPRFGRGKAMNPCIDCHSLMFSLAGKIEETGRFDILATGEVLGQRPLSQNRNALRKIEKETGLERKLLRPLSAKLFEPTIYEEQGFVDRDKLEEISGRGRKRQMELAEKFGIKDYPSPAGGCRLTEEKFSDKLRELFEYVENPKASDFELLRFGRHIYKLKVKSEKLKVTTQNVNLNALHIILGKSEEENNRLEKLAESGDVIVKRKGEKGPTALIRPCQERYNIEENDIDEAKKLVYQYSKMKPEKWEDLKFEIITIKLF